MHWILQSLLIAMMAVAYSGNKVVEKRDANGKVVVRTEVRQDFSGNQVRDGSETHFDAAGTAVAKFHYKDDELDGPWYEWDAQHKLRAQGTYRTGRKEGSEVHYSPDGNKIEQSDYKNDHLNGKKIDWGADGKKLFDADYTDGDLNGKLRMWYPGGKPKVVSTYIRGQETGISRAWYPTGQIASEEEFRDGDKNGRAREWYPDGKQKIEAKFRNGQLDGVFIQWYPDGVKQRETIYSAGEINGPLTQWFDSPNHPLVAVQSTYDHGQINGIQQTFYEKSGKKRLEVTARDGQRQGPWADWYENGLVHTKGTYKDDQLDGPIWFFYDDGKKWSVNSYSNGVRNGRWAEWNRDGNLVRDQYFHDGELVADKTKKPTPVTPADEKPAPAKK